MIDFKKLSDKEFYDLLEKHTNLTKYFKKKVLKQFKKYLEKDYPNGIELDYFIENCPDGEYYHKLFGYLGEVKYASN